MPSTLVTVSSPSGPILPKLVSTVASVSLALLLVLFTKWVTKWLQGRRQSKPMSQLSPGLPVIFYQNHIDLIYYLLTEFPFTFHRTRNDN